MEEVLKIGGTVFIFNGKIITSATLENFASPTEETIRDHPTLGLTPDTLVCSVRIHSALGLKDEVIHLIASQVHSSYEAANEKWLESVPPTVYEPETRAQIRNFCGHILPFSSCTAG